MFVGVAASRVPLGNVGGAANGNGSNNHHVPQASLNSNGPVRLPLATLQKRSAVANDENAPPEQQQPTRSAPSLLKAGLAISGGGNNISVAAHAPLRAVVQQPQSSIGVYADENIPPRASIATRVRVGSAAAAAAAAAASSASSSLPAAPGGPAAIPSLLSQPPRRAAMADVTNLPAAASRVSSLLPMDRRPASASSASLQLANTLGAQAQAAAARLQQQQFSMPTAQPVCAAQEAEAIVLDEVVTEAVPVAGDTTSAAAAAVTASDIASTAAVVAATAVDLTATAMELCSSPAPEEAPVASTASENVNTIHNENVSMAAPTPSPTAATASTTLAVEADQYAPDSHLWSTRYASEIVSHWFEAELRHAARADYMSVQPDLNGKMREILVDWLHEVVSRFRLQPETLFLAVNVLDRFLSLRAVNRKKLQLVGCVALLLACKYEEIYSPEIKDFLIISDNAYAREHVLHMEGVMLNALSFRLTHVSPLRFLQRFMHLPSVGWMAPASAEDACAQQLCLYLLELTLQFVDFLQFRPSTIAASVLFLVRAHCHQVLAGAGPAAAASLSAAGEASFAWGGELERETRLQARDLLPCTQVLYAHWSALNQAGSVALAASQQAAAAAAAAGLPPPAQAPAVAGNKCLAVYRKYTKERHCMVSQIKLLPPPKME